MASTSTKGQWGLYLQALPSVKTVWRAHIWTRGLTSTHSARLTMCASVAPGTIWWKTDQSQAIASALRVAEVTSAQLRGRSPSFNQNSGTWGPPAMPCPSVPRDTTRLALRPILETATAYRARPVRTNPTRTTLMCRAWRVDRSNSPGRVLGRAPRTRRAPPPNFRLRLERQFPMPCAPRVSKGSTLLKGAPSSIRSVHSGKTRRAAALGCSLMILPARRGRSIILHRETLKTVCRSAAPTRTARPTRRCKRNSFVCFTGMPQSPRPPR